MSLSPLEIEKHIGNASMQTAASSNLIFTNFSSFKRLAEVEKQISHAGLYQGIAQALIRTFNADRSLGDFATRLVAVADNAYLMRRSDVVGCVGELLLSLPLSRQLEYVAQYYRGLSLNRAGHGETARAGSLFELVADNASFQYRARAMLALGTTSLVADDHKTAASFYQEAMGLLERGRTFDPMILYTACRMTALIRGSNGDHQGAVANLEKMLPIVRMARSIQPFAYYDYLNALAVELSEVGRLEQARWASEIALASPFAFAYPNWRETFDDIVAKQQRASRSIIAVPERSRETPPPSSPEGRRTFIERLRESRNLVRLPAPEVAANVSADPQRSGKTPGRVLNFEQWKTLSRSSSGPLPARLSTEQREQMTTAQKLIRLMDLVSRDETDDETIDRILEAVEGIVLGSPKAN